MKDIIAVMDAGTAGRWLSVLFLTGAAVPDYRSRKIPLFLPLLFGAAGISMQIFLCVSGKWDPVAFAVSFLPCAIMAVPAVLTDSVGAGDALCLSVIALLERISAVGVFLGGILMASFWGIILLACRRAHKTTRLPFMPFLLAAQILYCLASWRERI